MKKKVAFVKADTYILAGDYEGFAPFMPSNLILTSYGTFKLSGAYEVFSGFLFSASFPAINTLDSRRAAMCHDFFYSLMKEGYLDRKHRYAVDYLFYNMLIEDGMIPLRAWLWFRAVRFGGDNALDSPKPAIQYAPSEPAPQAGWQLKGLFR